MITLPNIENHYQETDLGNVAPNPRGTYSEAISYEYLDTVSYQGGSYMCIAELGAIGVSPIHGENTETWQMLTLPGDLTPEYIAAHDDVVAKTKQVEASRAAVELSQQEVEAAQVNVQQLHEDTRTAAREAEASRDSASGSAQAAEASRTAAKESEDNAHALTTGFDERVAEEIEKAKAAVAEARLQAVNVVESQKDISVQAVKDQTAEYISQKENEAKTEIGNYTSEKITEINKKTFEANTTLANTIADGITLKTQLETTISTADTSKKNLDASNTAAGKTKNALDASNTTAARTKANLDASNTTALETKTGLDATNKTAAGLTTSLGDKITEGTQVKTDIQTTGETVMSNLQAEAAKQQEYIKTSIDDTLSISGKAADAAVVGEKLTSMGAAIESVKKNVENQSRSIANIQSAIKELNKKMSIDTYDELAEALVSGKIEDYVNVGDELMVNRIKTLSITSSNGNLSFEVSDEQKFIRKVGRIDDDTYLFEYRGNSWMYLEEAINTSDFGFAVKGTPSETDLIYVKMNYEQVSHTFVDFDSTGENVTHPKNPDVKHFAIIEQTYVPDAFNYDYPESALCITPGYTLPKGKYYIYNTANATSDYWCNYKRLYYAFEILNNIVATEETGDIQLQFYSRGDRETTGDARGIYELTCKPYCCATKAFYNSDTVKFVGQVAQPGEEYTDIRTIENFTVNQSMDSAGIIYNNLGHVCYGNNEWNVSNLRQRMNSNEKSMNPVRAHKNDALNGMYNAKGFMWGFDPRFTNLIKPCIVSLEHGMNDEYTRYQLYTCEDVATLLSMKEMSFNIQTDEGQITKLYGTYTNNQLTNDAVASRAKARQAGGTPQDYRWSRSAVASTRAALGLWLRPVRTTTIMRTMATASRPITVR